jgi:hypothetical protein
MSHLAALNASALSASRPSIWTGRALSGLVILFLVMDANGHRSMGRPVAATRASETFCRLAE